MKKSKIIILAVACGSMLIFSHSFGRVLQNDNDYDLSCSMVDKLIQLKGDKKYSKVKWEQQNYISKNYEGYRIVATINSLPTNDRNSFIQSFVLENDEGKKEQIYFDVTAAYNARNHRDNKELKQLVTALEEAKKPDDQLSEKDWQEIGNEVDRLMKEELKDSTTSTNKPKEEEMKRRIELINKLIEEKKSKK